MQCFERLSALLSRAEAMPDNVANSLDEALRRTDQVKLTSGDFISYADVAKHAFNNIIRARVIELPWFILCDSDLEDLVRSR